MRPAKSYPQTTGERAKELRGGTTQEGLAALARGRGYPVTNSDVSRLENGSDIGLEKLAGIALVLGVSADYLLMLSTEPVKIRKPAPERRSDGDGLPLDEWGDGEQDGRRRGRGGP